MRRVGFLIVTLVAVGALVAAPALAEKTALRAVMAAEEEVPSPGPAGGKGTADVETDDEAGQLCYKLKYSGIGEPTGAHIHEGAKGTAGPVAVDLDIEKNGKAGCVPVDKAELVEIAEHPDEHYVNVHTADYPKGAIRGQLAPAS